MYGRALIGKFADLNLSTERGRTVCLLTECECGRNFENAYRRLCTWRLERAFVRGIHQLHQLSFYTLPPKPKMTVIKNDDSSAFGLLVTNALNSSYLDHFL